MKTVAVTQIRYLMTYNYFFRYWSNMSKNGGKHINMCAQSLNDVAYTDYTKYVPSQCFGRMDLRTELNGS